MIAVSKMLFYHNTQYLARLISQYKTQYVVLPLIGLSTYLLFKETYVSTVKIFSQKQKDGKS